MLSAWGLELFPLTPDTIRALGSTLRAGGYRAFANYLSLPRVEAERAGQVPDPVRVCRAIKDAERSCGRGLAQPKQSECLPLEGLSALPGDVEPWIPGGPLWPRCLLVLGTWWLLWEIEVSNSRVDDLRVFRDGIQGAKLATWFLSASKTDVGAAGVERSHGCCCSSGSDLLCPVCIAELHIRAVSERFGRDISDGEEFLFPTALGAPPSKEAVVMTIEEGARRLGLALERADGQARF